MTCTSIDLGAGAVVVLGHSRSRHPGRGSCSSISSATNPASFHRAPSFGPFVTIVYGYVEATLKALLGIGAWSRLSGTVVITEALKDMFWSMLVYCLVVGVWEAYLYHQRYVSAELQMERLQRNFQKLTSTHCVCS